jgi:thioredoxin-related protein
MKQKLLSLALLCIPTLLFSQESKTNNGIKWTEGLSWQQVKAKAKKENKYIFVDCYATWCKPCKKMDKEVYTVDSVGDYLNEKFISVKLQMDVTKNDNEEVKSWRKTARYIESQYRISAYPSYVFFAPSGQVVSKEVGYRDPASFLQVTQNVTEPANQYFVLYEKYKKGKLDHAGTVTLLRQAKQIGDTADYRQILNSYYDYLRKQKKEKLYTKENIEFVACTLDRSSMVLFNMFYPNGTTVNRVMESDWYAKKVVDNIINNEKVQPFLNTAGEKTEPNWKVLYRSIAKNYGEDYAGRNVLNAKYQWYAKLNDGLNVARSLNDKMEKYGSDTTDLREDFRLNTAAYLIWLNVGRTSELSKEIIMEFSRICTWFEGVARRGEKLTSDYVAHWDMYVDTYANLLHKAGRTSEAIRWEEFAMSKLKENVKDAKEVENYWRMYEESLDKMRAGQPTWPIDTK